MYNKSPEFISLSARSITFPVFESYSQSMLYAEVEWYIKSKNGISFFFKP